MPFSGKDCHAQRGVTTVKSSMKVRWATPDDAPVLASVFYEAVRKGPSPYSDAQRVAWVPATPDPLTWRSRLNAGRVSVSELDGRVAGFMLLTQGGYIDLAFVLHDFRGRGVFRALYKAIEKAARRAGMVHLRTHASLMAEPAFRAVGFRVIQWETVTRAGETLRRAEMEKTLR